ncbi:MAG: T9SS type B sorting domain-containing protein [Paludibacteraceae bacterium]|nr:T9SS type B sorting domain-containing protein [Paludibacteraceae bacterium]
MKNTFTLVRYVAAVVICLFFGSGMGAYAQFNQLPLISGTNFYVEGAEANYYKSVDEITGWLGLVKPSISLSTFKLVDTTNTSATKSHFLTDGAYYGINNTSFRLDTIRLRKNDDWGMVISGGKSGFQYGTRLLTMVVEGLKPGSSYRIEVDYCNPMTADYTNPQSTMNQGNATTKRTTQEVGGLMANVNFSGTNYKSFGAKLSSSSTKNCMTGTLSYTQNDQTTGAIGSDGRLTLNLVLESLAAHSALKIAEVRIYGQLDAVVLGPKPAEVCAGGETAKLSISQTYMGATYQWYRDNQKISGETGPSYLHVSGNNAGEHTYKYDVVKDGKTVLTSTSFTVKDIVCCIENGKPSSRKMIWQDDFGTFTSPTNYWNWDYTDINNPTKVKGTTTMANRYEYCRQGETIPGATCEMIGYSNGYDQKFGEGKYTYIAKIGRVNGNVSDNAGIGWVSQTGDGSYPDGTEVNGTFRPSGKEFFPDHTYPDGSEAGACLMLNCGNKQGEVIYSREINNLCERKLTVKCYINNFSASGNPVIIKVRITDLKNNNYVESDAIKRYSTGHGKEWVEISEMIDLTGTSMKFEIVSVAGDGYPDDPNAGQCPEGVSAPCPYNMKGNDLLLDDIQVWACSAPPVDLYFSLKDLTVEDKTCEGDTTKLMVDVTDAMKKYYEGSTAMYVYEYTKTPEKKDSWKPINTTPVEDVVLKDVSSVIKTLDLKDGDDVYFRVVMGIETVLNEVLEDPSQIFNPDAVCAAYVVSEPILLHISCPECTEPKDPKISADKTIKDGVITLCKGESVTLSSNDITGKDKHTQKPYTEYTMSWSKDGSVLSKTDATTAPNLTVSWSDVTETGTKYKVLVHDKFEDQYGTTGCDKFDEVTVIGNPVPKTDPITVPTLCETDPARASAFAQSVAHLSAYTIKWYATEADALADDNETSEPDVAGAAAQSESYVSYFTITDKTTGCVSEPYKYTFTIQAVPADLTTQSVQYLKSTGTTFTNTILKTGIKAGEEATATTYWMGQYPTQQANITDFSSRVTDPAAPVAQYPDDKTKDEKVYYYVYQVEVVNGFDCASTPTEIEVDILGAPAPNVTDTVYCLNDTPDEITKFATVNDNGTNKDYELVWFNNESDAPAQGSLTPPTISTTASGLFTFYVAQRDKDDPDNISTKRKVNVSVYDVPVPTATTPIHYCVGETPVQLSATQGATSTYVQADGYKWVTVATNAESTTAPTPTTTAAGEQDFQVIGSYLLVAESQKYCYSEPFDIKVTVSETKAPAAQTVQYIKADVAADGKTFPSLDAATNNPWKTETTEPNFNYYYSAISTSDAKPTSGYTQGVPSPSFDVSALSGNTQELYCYVYREDKSNPKACPSETIMITIKISDALPPIIKDVYVCEGTTIPDLSAEIALLPGSGKTAADYDLIWYGDKDPNTDNTATESHVGESTYPMGNTAVANNASVTKYYYYVTQREKSTGAESTPSKITVNVLPKPVVTPLMVPQQCEGTVDLNNWYKVDNSGECGSPLTPNYTSSTNIVDATGIYPLTVSYPLGYSSPDYIVNSENLCISEEAKIQVIIDKLDSVWIEGDTTVCPGGDVELQAKLKSETHGENDCTYSWIDNKGTTNNHISFVNHYPETYASEADKIYQYTVTVTAGTCEETSPVHVVKVGNGQVRGTMSVIEPDNAWPTTSFENDVDREFYSCGGQITLKIDYEKTEGDFNWTVNGTAYKTGSEITIDETTVSSDKTYEVTYINKCETKAKILIHTIPLTVVPEVSIDTLCEGEPFTTKLDITCIETPTIQWYLNTNEIPGATNATYSVASVLESNDDGQYSYKVVNRGCTREGDSRYLDVQRYMKVTEFPEPFIVKKNADQTIQLMVEVPETTLGVEIDKIDWVENGVSKQATSSRSYTETGVVADHTYEITLTDNDYCSTSTTATIWVEADLQLKTDLKDTICLGSSAILTIDTTGTGAFRKKGVEPSLTVLRYTQGTKEYVTSQLRKNGDMLEMEVSPTDSASYTIEFSYDDQKLEPIVEIVNVIQAIDLKLPPVSTICEGDTIKLGVSDVTPLGTTVSWRPTETIISGAETDTIVAVPTYTQSLNHQFTYTYIVTATNKQCDESKEYKVPVIVDEALVGVPTGPGVICEGDQAKVDASSYEASVYLWTANGDTIGRSATIVVRPKETTVYNVEMSRGVCTATDEYELQVTSLPVITSVDSVGIRDREIVMEPGKGTGTFYYWVDTESSKATDNLVYNLTFAKHVAFVRDENGCQTSYPFEVLAPPVIIPEFFTPNGDGVNDTWVVEVLREVYTDAKVQIYDRFGKLMTEYLGGESEGWDGLYKGVPMPSTDYWYLIDIEEIDRQYSGHFTLIRQ